MTTSAFDDKQDQQDHAGKNAQPFQNALIKKTPFPLVTDRSSPEFIAIDQRATEILARMARYDEDQRIRAAEHSRYASPSETGSQNSQRSVFQNHDWSTNDQGFQVECAAEAEIEPVFWLLLSWIALCKLILLAGASRVGKSTLLWSIVARLTQLGEHPSWPESGPPGWSRVLVISAEESYKGTIVSRLKAAGANLDRVFNINGIERFSTLRPFRFWDEDDIEYLVEWAENTANIGLIVIDPVYLIIQGDSSNNAKMREALEKLAKLAERLRCAIICIAHTMKSTKGKDPLNCIASPRALVEVPRGIMMVSKIRGGATEDGATRVLILPKPIGRELDYGLTFSIETAIVKDNKGSDVETSKVVWRGKHHGTPEDIFQQSESGEMAAVGRIDPVSSAVSFLRQILQNGPVPCCEIKRLVSDAGISTRNRDAAKKELGVVSFKGTGEGQFSGFYWRLPESADT